MYQKYMIKMASYWEKNVHFANRTQATRSVLPSTEQKKYPKPRRKTTLKIAFSAYSSLRTTIL